MSSFYRPTGVLVLPSGTLAVIADYYNNDLRLCNLSSSAVSTLAGSLTSGGADGIGTASSFYYPWGLAVDAAVTFLLIVRESGREQCAG